MESYLELLVQDSRPTDSGDALLALNSDSSSALQPELTSSNVVASPSWADDDGSFFILLAYCRC